MLVLLAVSRGLDLDPFIILPVQQMLPVRMERKDNYTFVNEMSGTIDSQKPVAPIRSSDLDDDDPYTWFTSSLLPALANTLHYTRQDRLKLYGLFSTNRKDPFITQK
jgi:hypothetical protein